MASIICSECGKEITSPEKFCPFCACPIKRTLLRTADLMKSIDDDLLASEQKDEEQASFSERKKSTTHAILSIVFLSLSVLFGVLFISLHTFLAKTTLILLYPIFAIGLFTTIAYFVDYKAKYKPFFVTLVVLFVLSVCSLGGIIAILIV